MRRMWNVVVAAVLAPAAAWADAIPLPGYWELSNTTTMVFSATAAERKCLTSADILKVLEGPSNRHYQCAYPTRVVGNGHIQLAGTCVTKHGQVAEITAEGDYGPSSFRLHAKLKTRIGGVLLTGAASTRALRLGDTWPPLLQS
ncbi:hypothetical protein BH10PSE5_BH10PSE5_07230 [soil metagenome]